MTPPVARAAPKLTEGSNDLPEAADKLPDSSIPFIESSIISALDSASQYAPGIAESLPPPPSTVTDLSNRRTALFARPGKTTAETGLPIAGPIATPVATLVAAPASSEPTVAAAAPSVVPIPVQPPTPKFQLPEAVPSNAAVPFESVAIPLQLDGLAPVPVKPAISIPADEASKKSSQAAWRGGRHRSTLNESPRYRPKLGR